MTPDPLTLSVDADLDAAIALMDENDIRHVPVVEDGKLVGVLSDRDLLSVTGWLPASERGAEGPQKVRDLISARPVKATPDDSVVMVAVDLTSRGIGCLPVVEDGRLIGIVSEMDLIRAYAEMIDNSGGSDEFPGSVADHMATRLTSLRSTSTLAEALALAEEHFVRHLPVVDDDVLVGIVSDRDLRRAVGRQMESSTAISELMTADPIVLEPTEALAGAATRMREGRISALPVVKDGRLVGILTLTDILNHCIVNLRTPGE